MLVLPTSIYLEAIVLTGGKNPPLCKTLFTESFIDYLIFLFFSFHPHTAQAAAGILPFCAAYLLSYFPTSSYRCSTNFFTKSSGHSVCPHCNLHAFCVFDIIVLLHIWVHIDESSLIFLCLLPCFWEQLVIIQAFCSCVSVCVFVFTNGARPQGSVARLAQACTAR